MSGEDGFGGARGQDGAEAIRDSAQRPVPGDRLESAFALGARALQGMQQALPRIAPGIVTGEGAFGAQRAPTDRVVAVAPHRDHLAGAHEHLDSASIVAIARAGGLDDFSVAHRRHDDPGSARVRNRQRAPAATMRPAVGAAKWAASTVMSVSA